MGDMSEIFKANKEYTQTRRHVRDEYYSKIIESLGGSYINNSTYRLGDYNVYTSKGYVMHKSNYSKMPLQVFLKEQYNFEVDGKELNEKMKESTNVSKN